MDKFLAIIALALLAWGTNAAQAAGPVVADDGTTKCTSYNSMAFEASGKVTIAGCLLGGGVPPVVSCATPPGSVRVFDLGVLPVPSKGGSSDLAGFTNDKRWEIQAGQTLAVKFQLSATEPIDHYYEFALQEATGGFNSRKELAISTCPGVFNNLTAYCEIKQTLGTDHILMLTSANTPYHGCQVSAGGTYYLNMRGIDPGYIKFIMQVLE